MLGKMICMYAVPCVSLEKGGKGGQEWRGGSRRGGGLEGPTGLNKLNFGFTLGIWLVRLCQLLVGHEPEECQLLRHY